jgi:hypothetical protein
VGFELPAQRLGALAIVVWAALVAPSPASALATSSSAYPI